MLKKENNPINIYGALSAIMIALALLAFSLAFAFSSARYVAEVGDGSQGNDLPYDTQMPFNIRSQQDLYNAVTSGYGYIKLDDSLSRPIVMTGDPLALQRNLTLDLNGKEIQRDSRGSLLNIPSDKRLTIIDSAGGGGLYNPTGTVLGVTGGDLNVYGGTFESGPRPQEYYTNLASDVKAAMTKINVAMLAADGSISGTAQMPQFVIIR